ncbi:MAG: hypothetical protein ACOYK8_07615 [Alphaproteobacteria bacterium]
MSDLEQAKQGFSHEIQLAGREWTDQFAYIQNVVLARAEQEIKAGEGKLEALQVALQFYDFLGWLQERINERFDQQPEKIVEIGDRLAEIERELDVLNSFRDCIYASRALIAEGNRRGPKSRQAISDFLDNLWEGFQKGDAELVNRAITEIKEKDYGVFVWPFENKEKVLRDFVLDCTVIERSCATGFYNKLPEEYRAIKYNDYDTVSAHIGQKEYEKQDLTTALEKRKQEPEEINVSESPEKGGYKDFNELFTIMNLAQLDKVLPESDKKLSDDIYVSRYNMRGERYSCLQHPQLREMDIDSKKLT